MSPAAPDPIKPSPIERVPIRQVLRYFLGLGTWGFGGPIATVGYMHRDLVDRRAWVRRDEFLNGVALGQTMPGPLAAQVVMWVGFLRSRFLGALGAAAAFILPSFIVVLGVAVLYVRYQGLDWVQGLFYGIAPGVMAIIAIAAVRLARLTNGREVRLWVVSAITLAVTAITGAEIAILFVAAGLVIMLWDAPIRFRRPDATALIPWILPLGQLATVDPGTQVALFLFFLKAGAFIFGSGLAIVPFLEEGVVHERGWLTESQFLDAVAMGLITPGPVVITATFIGYLVGGFLGAGVATVGIFLPIYLGVVIPGPWFIRHADHPRLRGFVKGATAAAAGAIGGVTIVLTRSAVTDVPTAVIAVTGLLLLLVLRVPEPVVVAMAGVAGLLLVTF